MFYKTLMLSALVFAAASAQTSPCPTQQQSLGSLATQHPKPTGDLSSYISSYSSAHNGVFSNCDGLTDGMPSSLTSPYQAWVSSVSDWSVSLESTISAAQSTCQALVVNVVIATPLCASSGEIGEGNSATPTSSTTSSTASSNATGTTSSSSQSSGAGSYTRNFSPAIIALVAGAGALGAVALIL